MKSPQVLGDQGVGGLCPSFAVTRAHGEKGMGVCVESSPGMFGPDVFQTGALRQVPGSLATSSL